MLALLVRLVNTNQMQANSLVRFANQGASPEKEPIAVRHVQKVHIRTWKARDHAYLAMQALFRAVLGPHHVIYAQKVNSQQPLAPKLAHSVSQERIMANLGKAPV